MRLNLNREVGKMRIARLGELNKEKPAVVISDTEAVFVDDLISDFNRAELENGAIAKLQKVDLSSRSKVVIADYRIGSPVARPTKVICVGLNYAKHAFESFMEPSPEPIVFMKAPDSGEFADLCGVCYAIAYDFEDKAESIDDIIGGIKDEQDR